MNPGIEAVRTLAHLGYRFTVNAETIKAKYYGPGEPDPSQVKPLLEAVKGHKPEVLDFLRCFCPNGKLNDDDLAGGKPISICPQCQGEIFLRTSFGKKYCYQCLTELNGEIFNGPRPTCLNEVDRVLEEAVEKAEERAAILEHDGGLERKQADETARGIHIQLAIDELVRRGFVAIEGRDPGTQITTLPSAKPAKVANLQPVEAPQASPPACPVPCAAVCPWHELNPWTRNPALGAWCRHRMENLVVGSAVCEAFRRGEVPLKTTPNTAPQAPAPGDSVLTCADCNFHEYQGLNLRQGWGRCRLKKRGCYGLRQACSEIQRQDTDVPLDG